MSPWCMRMLWCSSESRMRLSRLVGNQNSCLAVSSFRFLHIINPISQFSKYTFPDYCVRRHIHCVGILSFPTRNIRDVLLLLSPSTFDAFGKTYQIIESTENMRENLFVLLPSCGCAVQIAFGCLSLAWTSPPLQCLLFFLKTVLLSQDFFYPALSNWSITMLVGHVGILNPENLVVKKSSVSPHASV